MLDQACHSVSIKASHVSPPMLWHRHSEMLWLSLGSRLKADFTECNDKIDRQAQEYMCLFLALQHIEPQTMPLRVWVKTLKSVRQPYRQPVVYVLAVFVRLITQDHFLSGTMLWLDGPTPSMHAP